MYSNFIKAVYSKIKDVCDKKWDLKKGLLFIFIKNIYIKINEFSFFLKNLQIYILLWDPIFMYCILRFFSKNENKNLF